MLFVCYRYRCRCCYCVPPHVSWYQFFRVNSWPLKHHNILLIHPTMFEYDDVGGENNVGRNDLFCSLVRALDSSPLRFE